MNGWVRFVILCFTINIILLPVIAKAQNLNEIVDFADSQYQAKNYKSAIQEYNRALFFGCQQPGRVYHQIANAYFELQDLDQCIVFFDKSWFNSTSDSIRNEAVLGKSLALIMQNQPMLALSELMNLDSLVCIQQNARQNLLQGVAYFGVQDDLHAKACFQHALTRLNPDAGGDFINAGFNNIKHAEKRFNPRTAWFLSAFLPGSGQLYAKEYKNAANSLLLVGGMFYLAIRYAANASILEALFFMLPWVQRYYLGGAGKAEILTREQQLKQRNRYMTDMVNALEKEFESSSNPGR